MKLQVAIDYTNIEEAFALMQKIEPYIDIIEIGTMLGFVRRIFCTGKNETEIST